MPNEETNPLNIIQDANSKTFDYFNEAYMNNLELLQNLKTELFESEVQIETLEKTRELYAYHIDNRRDVFSPLSEESSQTITKGKQIAMQIKDLEETKERLKERISEVEQNTAFYKEQVEMLLKAEKCIHSVLAESNNDNAESRWVHHYNMLKLEDYTNCQYATNLNQNVKQELASNLNKLDTLKWLLQSDLNRAKVTLEELHASQKAILDSLDAVLGQLNYYTDTGQPVRDHVNKLVERYQREHPECTIEFSCDCVEHELILPSAVTIRFTQMLGEIFDNIFKHSNADKVTAKISVSSSLIDVDIKDNGVGIPKDYLEQSNWYSGLHKLHEIIYHLDGTLQIQGNSISGTDVTFSFPIKNEISYGNKNI